MTLVPADPTTIIARNSQPSDSTALVRNDGDQLIIDLPRPSHWRSVHFAFLMFCLVWNGLLTLFTCLFTIAAFAGKIQSDDPAEQAPIWVLVLFLIPFYLIGGVSLTYWIGMSRRWARIVLSAETLQVTDHKLWKTTTTEWPTDQIVAVRALSQKHENDEEVTWSQGLLIEPLEGVPLAFLEWRPKSELEWLATTLCQALKLPGI